MKLRNFVFAFILSVCIILFASSAIAAPTQYTCRGHDGGGLFRGYWYSSPACPQQPVIGDHVELSWPIAQKYHANVTKVRDGFLWDTAEAVITEIPPGTIPGFFRVGETISLVW